MKVDEKQLLQLKQDIEDAEKQVAELKGQYTYLKKELKKDWNCDTTELAEKKIEAMRKEAEKLDKQIDEGVDKLREIYDI